MRSILIILLLIAGSATMATAQNDESSGSFVSGIKVRGNVHFNRTTVDDVSGAWEARNAYGLGVEFVLKRLGLGLYGYADGRTSATFSDTTTVYVVAEANYYLPIEDLKLAPYVGVHTHLGNFDRSYFDDPFVPKPQDGFDSLGYQVGLRFKPFSMVGLDAQWRRQSESVWEHQNGFLDRNQFLVGLVLF